MSIRTPDQRLRVFVSSTLGDLAAERDAVRHAVETLRLTPVMFELGARPHPPRALYRSYLEQSEVFIGLYWQQYGWVAPGEEVSGLEDEYRLAGDRPKLIYLKQPAPDRERRLVGLLDRIRAEDRVSYRHFRDAAELGSLVADDLAVLLSERFSTSPAKPGGPRPIAADRHPLPQPLTRLIGRDRDVEHLSAILEDPAHRLVTLTGPGGVGKTRLAIATAERLPDAYSDGVYFVPLAAVTERDLVLPSIAQALGIAEATGATIGAALREVLQASHSLIVLDNLEQIPGAGPEVAELLAATQSIQVLATSRRRLNIRGEQVVTIGPLDLPERPGEKTAAVELFLDRIREMRPGYEPSEADAVAMEELARRLDGLPLAIELASARLRLLTPAALLERMGHRRLEALQGGPGDLPGRQQTLRKTIAWSYGLLGPDERALFERLAVFVGSADLAAVEAIANPDGDLDTVETLGLLVDSSLLRTFGQASEPRFGMLETIREFATERLDEGGGASMCRARHTHYYMKLAAQGATGLGGPEQLAWLDRLTLEVDNLRGVLRRAIRQGDTGTAVRLGALLVLFWQMRSRFAEGRSWMKAARTLPGASKHERASAWTSEALLAFWQGDFEPLQRDVDAVIATLREGDDPRTLGFALLVKAIVGGGDAANEALAEASDLLGSLEDPFLAGIALLARSYVARLRGRIAEAVTLAESALRLSTDVGDSYVRAVASTLLATAALQTGDSEGVRAHALQALIAAQKLRNLSSAAYALELWAAAETSDGRLDRAGRLYALAQRAYGLASARPWSTEATLHRDVEERLRSGLGSRLDNLLEASDDLDFDAAITDLARSQPRPESDASGDPAR